MGVKKEGIGHSKTVTSRLIHSSPGCNFFAEVESGGKRVKRRNALRPFHRWSEREPNAGDDSVRAPGMQYFVNRFSFMENYARFRLHGDHFDGAHRLIIAKVSVRDRADSPGTSAEKSADRRLDDRRGIAPQFPPCLARFILEFPESNARLANGYAFRLNFLDAIHAAEIQNNAAF